MLPSQRYKTLVAYLEVKVYECDWHGVSDAANDIRELVALNPEVESDDLAKLLMQDQLDG